MSSLGGNPAPAAKKNNKNAKKKQQAKVTTEAPNNAESNNNAPAAQQENNSPPSSLGAPPSSLGGPPSSLGGPPKPASSLGGPPSSLGGPPKPAASSLGAPPSSLGGPPKPASSLGGPAPSSLGAPPSSLGGPPSALGGPPKPATPAGDNNNNAAESSEEAKKKEKEKKKKKKPQEKKQAVQTATPKKGDKNAVNALILKKREEEERRKREEEELRRKEEEQRRKEEEEERERELALQAKIAKKKQQQKESRKNKAAKEAERRRQEILKQFEIQGLKIGGQKPKEKTAEEKKKDSESKESLTSSSSEQSSQDLSSKSTDDVLDSWESLADSDEVDNNNSNAVEKEDTKTKTEGENQSGSSEPQGIFRSPICCVLGHVDTGKTLLLDKIRKSNVQSKEAGGITQQIGATYFPIDAIQNLTGRLSDFVQLDKKKTEGGNDILVPGLLIIDTPGHESFTNLRTRGSSLCDIAILVVDIMHGIEQQTEESIRLLKQRKTPFIVALNKIDRLNEWKPVPHAPIQQSLETQSPYVQKLYEEKIKETITLFAEKGLNSALYYRNDDFRKFISIVPTSAVSGEGIPDLLMLLIQLTQRMLTKQLYISEQVKCTVLEVKIIDGLGTTIDVILSDGTIREGEKIVVCGKHGPIVTTIRALLTPQPMREIRVKSTYMHHKQIRAAQGIKIVAHDLNEAVAGTQLFVVRENDDLDFLKDEVQRDLKNIQSIDLQDVGVYVQASTLGSLEALLCFLKESNIPVSNVGIGNLHKKDVTKASVMVEKDKKYACILAFDVKIAPDILAFAESLGVTVFSAPIIYHLEQSFTAYLQKIDEEKKRLHASEAVWPCVLEILPEYIFNKRNPLILGVRVARGELKLRTPICAIKEDENIFLGYVTSIEENHKQIEAAKKGSDVAIKIEPDMSEQIYMYDRHFDSSHQLMSRLTRHSIDRLKEFFADSLTPVDIKLCREMKKIYNID